MYKGIRFNADDFYWLLMIFCMKQSPKDYIFTNEYDYFVIQGISQQNFKCIRLQKFIWSLKFKISWICRNQSLVFDKMYDFRFFDKLISYRFQYYKKLTQIEPIIQYCQSLKQFKQFNFCVRLAKTEMNSSDLHSMSLNSSGDFSYNNADISNQFHSFQQNSESSNVQPDLNHISLIDEEKIGAFIEALEKVYKKLVQKVCYRYIPQTLESKRIIPDRKGFNSEGMLNELNKLITTETDSLQVWIRWNITERNNIIAFKKWLIEKEEQKLRKRQEINILIDKIAGKLKQKTVQKLIDDFTRTRKEKYQKFIENQKLSVQQQKIKNLFSNVSQVEKNFQKAQEKVDEFTRALQMKTGQNLNKIDHLFS